MHECQIYDALEKVCTKYAHVFNAYLWDLWFPETALLLRPGAVLVRLLVLPRLKSRNARLHRLHERLQQYWLRLNVDTDRNVKGMSAAGRKTLFIYKILLLWWWWWRPLSNITEVVIGFRTRAIASINFILINSFSEPLCPMDWGALPYIRDKGDHYQQCRIDLAQNMPAEWPTGVRRAIRTGEVTGSGFFSFNVSFHYICVILANTVPHTHVIFIILLIHDSQE